MEPVLVDRLRVRASAPLASTVGFTARLEDALRTASLPAEWRGRWVLVRRLGMRAGQGWSAPQFARRLEALWRHADARPVPAGTASRDAPAVWFEDGTSARLALIGRLARRQDVSAWFWQRLLPAGDLDTQLSKLASDCIRDSPTAACFEADFAQVCRAIGEPALIDRVIARIDANLLRWLIAASSRPAASDFADGAFAACTAGTDSSSRHGGDGGIRALARHFARSALRSDVRTQRPASDLPRTETADASADWSDWAGLFFALNLVRHADFAIDPDLVAGLRAIVSWLRVGPDDPVHALLDGLDIRDRLQSADQGFDAAAFLRSMRVACLRATRRPLRRVLRRTGRLVLNRTHLTVLFRLAEVSLAVRVAGLDIDPGWVAPLARVVRFEYD